jgi:hypothetical protein
MWNIWNPGIPVSRSSHGKSFSVKRRKPVIMLKAEKFQGAAKMLVNKKANQECPWFAFF